MSNQSRNAIRVRFAPSPTGHLHVGGARTAIFNWLFAKARDGVFVLRIEDTDVERSTPESEVALADDLRWLGLEWHEGPDKAGPFGPYRQSERQERYVGAATELVEQGRAYPCFCTDEELETKRKAAIDAGKPPQYDGTCRRLGADEVKARRSARIPEVIRFRVPAGTVTFGDLIRGPVAFDANTVGDFVLLRSTGHPTYNFAAVVDDHAMAITHVLRGEEHLPNTLRQILIYRALGASLPEFGHLPLILAEDRSKLSKRHGASSVGELREIGILPHAVLNYLVLLGWSHPEGREVLSLDELVTSFSLDRVNKSAAIYDRKKLLWMNSQYIRSEPIDSLFEAADRYFPEEIVAAYSDSDRRVMLHLLQDGIETLSDLRGAVAPFRNQPVMEDEAVAVLESSGASTVLARVEAALPGLPERFTAEEFKEMMKGVGKTTGMKGKDLFFPVRAALTGSLHGPDLASIAALRGREHGLRLVRRAREMSGAD